MRRNWWSAWPGMGGRHPSESMVGMARIMHIPPPNTIHLGALGSIVFDEKVDFFYLALFLFVIIALVINAFYSSWAGRAWKAIGLNPRLAQSMGVNVFRYRLLAFVVACAIAGLVGSFYAHYQTFIIPTAFNLFPKSPLWEYKRTTAAPGSLLHKRF